MFTPAIPAVLAVLVWLGLYFTGNDTHTADGIVFVLAVLATGWLLFRKQSLNDKAGK
ncbi:hypothetical protein [Hymenobacter ruber]